MSDRRAMVSEAKSSSSLANGCGGKAVALSRSPAGAGAAMVGALVLVPAAALALAPFSGGVSVAHDADGEAQRLETSGVQGGSLGPCSSRRWRMVGHSGRAMKARITSVSSEDSRAYASVNLSAIGPRSHCRTLTMRTASHTLEAEPEAAPGLEPAPAWLA